MNYNSETAFARVVFLTRAFLILTEEESYHIGHLTQLKYLEGQITGILEATYAPEDRDEKRLQAYVEAYRQYTNK